MAFTIQFGSGMGHVLDGNFTKEVKLVSNYRIWDTSDLRI